MMEQEYGDKKSEAELGAYRLEMVKDVVSKLVPAPEEIEAEIPLIGHLSGRRPNISDLYRASAAIELGFSLIEDRPFDWGGLDPAEWHKEHAVSVSGARAKHLVELAKATQVETKRSWWKFW